ncbi:hypothetical protein FCH28_06025 [Streptomyces piniterrae]|uniref:Chaplin n=1 Tax=Streptomyces piniterrae TaxID=2571125 RepID=A0A4U0NRI1_9ACTN|nr:hypothetical protein FCH28_06025 [Streptomyces piniterrae]
MRRAITVLLGTLAFLGVLASPASAVPDPVGTVTCLTQSVGDVTALVDPANPGIPAEIPGASCLAP